MYTLGSGEGVLRPPSNPRLSRRCRAADGRGQAPEPPHRCALTAPRRTVVVTRVPRANRTAYGPARALRLPEVGELAHEAVSALEEPWIAALLRIEGHRRLVLPGGLTRRVSTR